MFYRKLWFVCATTPFLCKPDYISYHSRPHILTPVTPKRLFSNPISASPTRYIHWGKFIHSGREQTITLYVYNMKAQIESYKYSSLTTDSRPALVLTGDGWVESLLWSSTNSSNLVLLFWGLLGHTVWHTKVLVTIKTLPTWCLRQVRPQDLTFPTAQLALTSLFLQEGIWLPN